MEQEGRARTGEGGIWGLCVADGDDNGTGAASAIRRH